MDSKKDKVKDFFSNWVVPIGVAIVLSIIINKFIVFKIEIPSESMVPTLNVGDNLYATRVHNTDNLEYGDLVIFNFEETNQLYIKRLIGLPGDEIIIDGGDVTRNGILLDEEYVAHQEVYYGEFTVPEGEYFFLGDNRANSGDSRYWEYPYIKEDKIEGRAFIKVYPFSDFGFMN